MENKLLQKATEMFLSYGFKSVTMDDIANELGMSKKTVYTYYPTKAALVEAVALNLFKEISEGIEAINAKKLDSIEEVFAIIQFVKKHVKDDRSSPIYQLQKYYQKVHKMLMKKQLEIMNTCVRDNILRGMASGVFRKDLDVDAVTRFYFLGMSGIKDPELFPPGAFPMRQLTITYTDYHLRAICTPKGLETLKKFIDEIKE